MPVLLLSLCAMFAFADNDSPRPTHTAAATTPAISIDERIANLQQLARNPDADAAAWVRLGDAVMQRSRETLSHDDYARAGAAYQRALTLEPRNVQALLGMAWVHNTQHEFATGRRFAESALEINPKLPEAHSLLGDAAVELGGYDTAFEHYQEALDLRPDLSSYSRAAHLLWLTGDDARAKSLMLKAIAADAPYAENTAWCRAQLALMSFHSGSLMIAERQVKLALKEAPDNPHVLAAAARINAAQTEYETAITLYQKSVEAAPTHEALAALVDLYELTGRQAEAREQFDRVVAFHAARFGGHAHIHTHGVASGPESPPHPHAAPHLYGDSQLACFYADHDRHLDEALSEARAAWRAFPNIMAADTLAWCLYKNGKYDEAARMIRRALKYNTPDAAIHFHAGMIFAKLGDHQAARKQLYHALNLNPRFHPRHAALAAETLTLLSSGSPIAEDTPAAASTGSSLLSVDPVVE